MTLLKAVPKALLLMPGNKARTEMETLEFANLSESHGKTEKISDGQEMTKSTQSF
jgi:hypothetical protein